MPSGPQAQYTGSGPRNQHLDAAYRILASMTFTLWRLHMIIGMLSKVYVEVCTMSIGGSDKTNRKEYNQSTTRIGAKTQFEMGCTYMKTGRQLS